MVKTWFPLARKFVSTTQSEGLVSKLRLSPAEVSEKQIKNRFQQLENPFPLTGMRLKIRFHQPENKASSGRSFSKKILKRQFQPGNQFPLEGIRLYFKNWISRFPQTERESLNKRILFQLDGKTVSTSGNEEFL